MTVKGNEEDIIYTAIIIRTRRYGSAKNPEQLKEEERNMKENKENPRGKNGGKSKRGKEEN